MTTINGTFKLTVSDATVVDALEHWFREKSPGLLADNQAIGSVERVASGYGTGEFEISVIVTKPNEVKGAA